jgi:pilus assembly protein Flp/PilA
VYKLVIEPSGSTSIGRFSMRSFAEKFVKFIKEEDGPTAVEYAVMLALIVVVCLGTIGTIGTNANATFTTVAGQL